MKRTSYIIIGFPIVLFAIFVAGMLFLAGGKEPVSHQFSYTGDIVMTDTTLDGRYIHILDIRKNSHVSYDSLDIRIIESDLVTGPALRGPKDLLAILKMKQDADTISIIFDWSGMDPKEDDKQRYNWWEVKSSDPLEIIMPSKRIAGVSSYISTGMELSGIESSSLTLGQLPSCKLVNCHIAALNVKSTFLTNNDYGNHYWTDRKFTFENCAIGSSDIQALPSESISLYGNDDSLIDKLNLSVLPIGDDEDSDKNSKFNLVIDIDVNNLTTDLAGYTVALSTDRPISGLKLSK